MINKDLPLAAHCPSPSLFAHSLSVFLLSLFAAKFALSLCAHTHTHTHEHMPTKADRQTDTFNDTRTLTNIKLPKLTSQLLEHSKTVN